MKKQKLEQMFDEWKNINQTNVLYVQTLNNGKAPIISPYKVDVAMRGHELAKKLLLHIKKIEASPSDKHELRIDAMK